MLYNMSLLYKVSFQYSLQPLVPPGFTSDIIPLNHSFIESHFLPVASLSFLLLHTSTLLPILTTSLKFHEETLKKGRRRNKEDKWGVEKREGRGEKEEERGGIEVGGWE